ncbi:MAG: hypothetical protein QOH26_1687, partial [Actinomycetota bacterium]|nr:hypothetical protein [Actinomycetota bacterium]
MRTRGILPLLLAGLLVPLLLHLEPAASARLTQPGDCVGRVGGLDLQTATIAELRT